MKKRLLATILLLLEAACGYAQRESPDTVRYGNSRYLFQTLYDTVDYYSGLRWRRFGTPSFHGYIPFSAIQPATVYGIAVVSTKRGPIFYGTPYEMAHIPPDPPNVDSNALGLYAVLVQQGEDGVFRHVDSARWHPRDPDRYYQFSYLRWQVYYTDTAPATHEVHLADTALPMYEFYFDRPLSVIGDYYVGFRSDHVFVTYDIWKSPHQWYWEVLHIGSKQNTQQYWYEESIPDTGLVEYIGMNWHGICPILAPPDTDAIPTLPVEGLRREEHWNGRSVFA